MNDRGITASYFLATLFKITNFEITTQFSLAKDSNSNRVNDLLRRNSIQSLYITFCQHFVIKVKNSN